MNANERECATLTITASDGITHAVFVPELGGVGSSLIMPSSEGGREILFCHPWFWDRDDDRTRGGLPFLFPIVGRLEHDGKLAKYGYEGKIYDLPLHGFSLNVPWVGEVVSEDTCRLTLTDTDITRAMYPFSFRVELLYRVEPGELICEQIYTNTGDVRMPYYAGFHPYFLTPRAGQGKEDVLHDFRPAAGQVYNESLAAVIGEDEPSSLPASVNDPALRERCHRLGADKETRVVFPDGMTIHMTATGEDPNLFPYVHLYTELEKPYTCVEPWMACPGALNDLTKSRWLGPGERECGALRLWVTE
ncbi:MAG: aldose epimerase [Verrucomicrobia bacterium]|nr:aldose epimerase [Verrucomicrobiota bacterium]